MKAPDTTKAASSVTVQGSQIIGDLPTKTATLTAEVLSRLLSGQYLTALEAVGEASTTRLAAVIEYLERRYNWMIQRRDKAAGCCDGRISWVSEYWLSSEDIERACKAGARTWQSDVRKARAALRAKAAQAERDAARQNEARRRAAKARRLADQFDFFEGANNG